MSATDVMEAHRYRGMDSNWMVRCSCGWTTDRINKHQMAMTLHDLHVLEAMAESGYAVVELPDEEKPSPALIEAAYVAQDDLSKPPPAWAIGAAAEVVLAYIDGQGHKTVHVIGHPAAEAAS